MTSGHTIAAGATALLLLLSAAGHAQPTREQAIQANADSILSETCRGGTLSASRLTCRSQRFAPRVTVLRRLALRIDSLARAGDILSPAPPTTPPPATVTVSLAATRDTITSDVANFRHWTRLTATVRAGTAVQPITAANLTWSLSDSSGVTIPPEQPDRFELHTPTRSGTVTVTARWVPTGATASRTIVLVGPASPPQPPPTQPPPTPPPPTQPPPTTPPPTLPADTSAVARLLGPFPSSSATSALGGAFARYEADFVKYDDAQWNGCHAAGKPLWDCVNYYDRAAIYYVWWRRTGNAKYRTRADSLARHFRGVITAGQYQIVDHWSTLDGIAVHAALTGDAASRETVGRVATRQAWYLNPAAAGYVRVADQMDNRIQAYLLRNLLLAHQINAPSPNNPTVTQGLPGGYAWPAKLREALNAILGTRDSDGQWRGAKCGSAGRATHPFTVGLLWDALIRYYEQFEQDPRIPEAIRKSAEVMWSQDWISSSSAFKYVGVDCPGEGGPTPAADLNNLIVNGFAWTYKLSGDSRWRTRADQIFAGSVNKDSPSSSAKHFNQSYTSSYRYLAWR